MTETPSPTPGPEPREPSRPAPDPEPAQPSQPTPAPEPGQSSQPTPRGVWLWLVVRYFLARYLQFWSRHRYLGCLGVLVLLAPLVLLTLRLGGATLPAGPTARGEIWPLEPVETNAIGSVTNEPADQVEEYIAGMREFDAQRMWSSYNEQVRSELASRGRSAEELQRGLSQARAGGARIDQVVRLGNYPLRDGRRYVFYVITRTGFPPNGGTEELYFVFTIDRAGKILSVT